MQEELLKKVASELNLPLSSVKKVLELTAGGATVPFIARYRRAQTGDMDEEQIRDIIKAYEEIEALVTRKQTVLKTIESQGKLTPELKEKIDNCFNLNQLEDIYLPYKPKRKTKAVVARENGLAPLADLVRSDFSGNADQLAEKFLNENVSSIEKALEGAAYIIAEEIIENQDVREFTRHEMHESGTFFSKIKKADHEEAYKFEIYDEADFDVKRLRPHQTLAIFRGENLGVLSVRLVGEKEVVDYFIKHKFDFKENLTFADTFLTAIDLAYKRYLLPSIEREIRSELKAKADEHAIKVFAENLRNLLMQPPLTGKIVLGIDSGFVSGCKVAVINKQGDYLEGDTIYPVPPKKQIAQSEQVLKYLIEKFNVDIIAIGNGTASRETEAFVANFLKKHDFKTKYLIVNEAGASVYSASPLAKKEFPNLDAAQRGNISIARRVLDPLAELVKIEPKSIGVGLYQHDVDQKELANELSSVVESCVNDVGVDLNTASATLLSFVSGLNERTAENIIEYRHKIKKFETREQLKDVSGIGAKAYEQAAGFLKIRDGKEFLDNTIIHPESYEQTKALLKHLKISTEQAHLLQLKLQSMNKSEQKKLIQSLELEKATFDLIVEGLSKPGRDPREDVPPPILKSDILSIDDLKVGMTLKGTVRNVVDFGAFVDIGLKSDALLHVSKILKNGKRVRNPQEVVQVGQVLSVEILDIDEKKKRVSLGMVE